MFENLTIIQKTFYAIIILVILIFIYKFINKTEQYSNKCVKKITNCNNCMKLPSNYLQNNVDRINPILIDKKYGLTNQLEIDI